ncbi:MalY/PatB family protein [Paenilisteria rocourtiae]|uniref:cysteine-S-conjugate beta-lyase n=1 Tax=Listeria rocourtiae TaxID=647910 RepID=A0A4R6ZH81_9LIST|nr:MalY/PatB family protein [Listeria rocourtiae]EUJ43085.1 Cystathionine beta-lyase PatB [Listeria rocourtiae FSL F6-920]MBC1605600.1 pyridoxal phosphate-dependent aminotransferase [Listeria rocourtiae]TDR51314.1 cystathionine beta-lyase [Listeria rocourtiae]
MSLFDEVIPRIGTNSEKWDDVKHLFGTEDIIPMWVADMDFKPPYAVHQAFQKLLDHGIFGYSMTVPGLKPSIVNWLATRHDYKVYEANIFLNAAVVPSLSMAIRSLTEKGDGVLMHSPVYHPFFLVTEQTKRKVVMSSLVYKDSAYTIDWTDFEEKVQHVKLFILCNPHNPGCRSWSRAELTRMAKICEQYGVPIISDEIHSDLTMPNVKHLPLAVAAPDYQSQIVTLMAPTKTFNLAGMKASFFITTNPDFQAKFEYEAKYTSRPELNSFGAVGMEAAYLFGAEWVDELRDYIFANYQYTEAEVKKHCPTVGVTKLEATYLMWLDCRALGLDDKTIYQNLINAGVGVQMGSDFGVAGSGFVRLNIACPRETLEKGVACLIEGLQKTH